MTASERLAARLEGATPGPWRSWGMQLRGSTSPESADLAHSILLADFYTERQGHPRTFDLDLTITLANAAPALTDLVQAVEKAQGLKKGEHVKPICLIRVVSSTDESLDAITERADGADECRREGFPDLSPIGFVEMFQAANARDCPYFDTIVNRIEFEYVP